MSSLINAGISLSKSWQVLGPFPAGMRETPFGGFPASVSASYAELFNPDPDQSLYFSTYGPSDATTRLASFNAEVQKQDVNHVKQLLSIEYPDVDWAWIRKSAGWSSLQWQMIAATDLSINQDGTAVAITLDKTAEFAIVQHASFSDSGNTTEDAIEWHTGDWYSYITGFSKEDESPSRLPISHHLIHLNKGPYKLLVRSMYEIRIFGDPHNDGKTESPRMVLGIDIATSTVKRAEQEDLIEIHTDPHHSNVPHVVGGWLAGWGLSFGVRNVHPTETYTLQSVEGVGASASIQAQLGSALHIVPGQTVMVPVKLTQSAPLDTNTSELYLTLSLTANSKASAGEKAVTIPLVHRPAFWESSSSDADHNAYMYSYLADDHTVQVAAATPPKRSSRAAAPKHPLPPLILSLHGAGVDVRDLFFSNSIQRQSDSWTILPTGRTPWGYDWQLASLQAADSAISAFHTHLYGLPHDMPEEEKQMWKFDSEKLFVMGHSNGGQGAWYRLSRFPDRAIGGMVAAAYTKVSDYVSLAWKVGRHFTDPALQGLLHSSITMFENDLFASNLAGLDLLVKYGAADPNVPPWNPKDMAMIVDGWNKRSGTTGKVKITEVPGKPHWWDELFSEEDVQTAIEAACTLTKNPGYRMPEAPHAFTLTVVNPDEAGSKGGWRISEVDVPGRLAKLEVRSKAIRSKEGDVQDDIHFEVLARNARRIELDLATLRRSSFGAADLINVTSIKISLNGRVHEAEIGFTEQIQFVLKGEQQWLVNSKNELAEARPIGPLLRIVSTQGPIVLVVPSNGPPKEVAAWTRAARRFSADLLLYGTINSQILTDDDFSSGLPNSLKTSNIVAFGGPQINRYTRFMLKNWPAQAPIHFLSPDTSAQFEIQGRNFYENGTALITLAPHPTFSRGLGMIVHGIGAQGIARAARLLPTRTATMIPEWVVVDNTAEWMGEGGVQAAGWYNGKWGWSESMSYLH